MFANNVVRRMVGDAEGPLTLEPFVLQHPVGLGFASGGDGELDKASTMGDPAHMIQVGTDRSVSICEGQRRAARQ